MVYEDIAANKNNTFILLFFYGILIAGLGWIIGALYGDPYTGIVIGVTASFVMTFFSYYNSDKVAILTSGAVEADRKMYPGLYYAAEGMALAAGLPAPKVYVMQSESINAFAAGRDPKHSAIAVTTGALIKLNKTELEGVIAHEMSHVKNYDILVSTVAAVMAGAVFMISDVIKRSAFRRSSGRAGLLFAILAIAAAILAPIGAMAIKFAVSRQREYMADASAVLLTRYPQGLIGALEKIKKETYPEEEYNSGMQHMYFANPFALRADNLFSTHPPLELRIERLKGNLYKENPKI